MASCFLMTPARNGQEPARSSRCAFFPIDLSIAANKTGRGLPISQSSSGRKTTGRRRPRAIYGSSRRRRCCHPARHSSRGSRRQTTARPGPRFFVTLDGRPVPRELIPLAAAAGRTGRDASPRPETCTERRTSSRCKPSMALAIAGRPRRPRSRSRAASPPPCLSPSAAGRLCPTSPSTAWPRIAGMQVAIIDELDKVHPDDRRIDPAPIPGLPGHQPSLERRGPHDHDSTRHATSLSRSRSCSAARSQRAIISPSWSSTGPRPERSKSNSAAITTLPSKLGLVPDPIVPLNFPGRRRTRGQEPEPARGGLRSSHRSAGVHRGNLDLEQCDDATNRCVCRWSLRSGTSRCPITSASCPR